MSLYLLLVKQLPIHGLIAQVDIELGVLDEGRAIWCRYSSIGIQLVKLGLYIVLAAEACKVILVLGL